MLLTIFWFGGAFCLVVAAVLRMLVYSWGWAAANALIAAAYFVAGIASLGG